MRLKIPCLLTLLCLTAAAGAQPKNPSADDLAKKVAPFVNDMTFLVAHIDAKRFDLASVFKLMDDLKIKEKDLAEARDFLTKAQTILRELGGRDIFWVLNWDSPQPHEDFLVVIPTAGKTEARTMIALLSLVPNVKWKMHDDTILFTTERNLRRLNAIRPKERAELAPALAAFSTSTAKVIVLPPPLLVRAFVELIPAVPEELGGGDTRALAEGIRWIGAGVDDELQFTLKLQASDEKTARGAQELCKHALDIPLHDPNIQLRFPQLLKMRDRMIPVAKGNQLSLLLDRKFVTQALGDLAHEARGNAARQVSVNNLKQIALAFHGYHDAHKGFPPAFTTNAKGRPLLSWRVYLLPYIEQEALFRQFKLDEPWDSPHNKKLAEIVVPIYKSPMSPDLAPGKTTYLVPVGPKSIFGDPKTLDIRNITDGTSNTILVVEANSKRAVYWSQPEDYPIDQKDLLAGLVNKDAKGFNAGFADGSVRWIDQRIRLDSLRGLLTATGGENVDENDLERPKTPPKK